MNRPQYFWPTPKGFQDTPFVRPVGFNTDPSGNFPAGQYQQSYVIQLDNDAPQLLRSLFMQGVQQGQLQDLQIQLKDAHGNYLTDGYVPAWLYFWGAGSTPTDGGSGRAKVFEPELYCPPGSVLMLDFFSANGSAYPGLMEFRGVKRFRLGVCK